MKVTLKYYGEIRGTTQCGEEKIEAASMEEVIRILRISYGDKILPAIRLSQVYLNREELATVHNVPLKDGDVLGFFSAVAGG
jgi:molybdopterin converting factor small subunit